ncbi:MAG TPA: hypothetical protein VMY34_00680, partial [Acidimicrobiales bacterium]|nr:hypothetical protein [Acidimicrobiales bacterium]
MPDAKRSRAARAASERALVRVVHHHGARPEFVVLGGLVPELLCAASGWRHAGTTDLDVQVDLEVACGAVNTARLENALRNAEFEPETDRVWRWVAGGTDVKAVVKFELLADLDTEPNEATVRFDACDNLGAVNLRGTGFASRDPVVQQHGVAGDQNRDVVLLVHRAHHHVQRDEHVDALLAHLEAWLSFREDAPSVVLEGPRDGFDRVLSFPVAHLA